MPRNAHSYGPDSARSMLVIENIMHTVHHMMLSMSARYNCVDDSLEGNMSIMSEIIDVSVASVNSGVAGSGLPILVGVDGSDASYRSVP